MAFTFSQTRTQRSAETLFHWLVIIAGSGLLLWKTYSRPDAVDLWHGAMIALLVAMQANFPLKLLHSEFNLIQVVALGGALLYGSVSAAWAVMVGLLISPLLRPVFARVRKEIGSADSFDWREALSNAGRNSLALLLSLQDERFIRGLAWHNEPFADAWPVLLEPILLFAGIHTALYLVTYLLRGPLKSPSVRRDLVLLGLVELLPLPFVMVGVTAYPIIGIFSLMTIGSIPLAVAVLLQTIASTRLVLEQRVQDLSILNQFSQALRATLDLEDLLSAVQAEISQLLAADNFYIAIHRFQTGRIWYPLAVKDSARQSWPERPLANRLTDRVIREGKALSIARLKDTQDFNELMPSQVTPTAWIGVPLISSERTLGCLALFSEQTGARYTPAELDLLTTLSGQISVAIEKALLYEQARRRARQLETLNGIGKLITSSLDEQEVLRQVGAFAVQISGAERIAVFLLDPVSTTLELAYSNGLSDGFQERNRSFPLSENTRTRSLRTGELVLIPDLRQATLERSFALSMQEEGVSGLADLPLLTPASQVGILSILFDSSTTPGPEDLELLRAFAGQAAVAIENARRHTRTDLALAQRVQQLSILETVGRELAGAIPGGQLSEIILQYACELTNSPWGCLGVYNSERELIEIKAAQGYKNPLPTYPVSRGISGRAVRGHQIINVPDTHLDPDWTDLTEGQARSQLSVPLIHEGRVLGVLTLENPQVHGYTENEQAFIEQLATQAAVSVANAQLFADAQRRLREQSTLYLVSTYLAGKLDLDGILQVVKRAIEAVLPEATVGMYLWDENHKAYSLHTSELDGIGASGTQQRVASRHLQPVISDRAVIGLHRTLSDPTPAQFLPGAGMPVPLAGICTTCQVLILPLVLHGQRQGMAMLHLPVNTNLGAEELQLLRAIMAQGTLSIQNAQLFSDVTHVRDRMAAVLDSVQEGILMIDAAGRVMLVNRALQAMTGLALEDLSGRPLAEQSNGVLQTVGFTPQAIDSLMAAMDEGQASESPNLRITVSHGTPERILERASLPVWGQGGRLIGWLLVFYDVTEQEQVTQEREIITETLIHDLRSPLTATIGALEVIEDEAGAGERANPIIQQSARIGRNSTQRVLSLVESLLDISRMQSGGMSLALAPVNLRQLTDSVLSEAQTQASDYGLALCNEIPHDLPDIPADAGKLGRVLVNLVDNALKYSPSGGKVAVTVDPGSENEIIVRVSDEGPGIPQEYREKIFERFGQIPQQRGRSRGSGLGLTFCKLAVEAHGGRIWVESRPDGGSVFSFTLPLERFPA